MTKYLRKLTFIISRMTPASLAHLNSEDTLIYFSDSLNEMNFIDTQIWV